MFKRRFSYLSALLVALFVCAAPLTAFAQDPLTEEYVSSSGALTLSYPAGWVYEEDSGLVAFASNDMAFQAEELPTGVLGVIVVEPTLLSVLTGTEGITSDEALGLLAAQLSEGEVVAESLTPEQTTIGGRPTSRLSLSVSANDLLLLGVDLDEGSTVVLVAMSSPGEMEQFEATVSAIAETIEYTPQWNAMLTGHTDWVRAVAFSPDGAQVASGSDDFRIRLWDVASGEEVASLQQPDYVYGLAYSPDGALLASIGSTTLYIFDVASGEMAEEVIASSEVVSGVAFSPDGSLIATGGDDMTIHLWALDGTWQEQSVIEGHEGGIYAVAFSPDGAQIASGGTDYSLRVWDVASGEELLSVEHPDWIRSIDYSPDGTLIVTGSDDGFVRLFDAETGETVAELEGHTDYVRSVAFGPDSAQIVSGSDDGLVYVWGLDGTWQELAAFAGHADWVRSVAFSPDGTLVASGSDDTTVILWDVP